MGFTPNKAHRVLLCIGSGVDRHAQAAHHIMVGHDLHKKSWPPISKNSNTRFRLVETTPSLHRSDGAAPPRAHAMVSQGGRVVREDPMGCALRNKSTGQSEYLKQVEIL